MSDNKKLVAILSYFLVGIIWYFADESIKGDKRVKHHVKQALNLLIISVIVNVLLSFIFILGWLIIPIIYIMTFVLWIVGLINAINLNDKDIPIIGPLADKYLKF